jgi:hypothetical protein
MFRDDVTLNGFLTNLADTVKVGGYFVGCCSDGDTLARKLGRESSILGHDGVTNVWAMTRRYGDAVHSVPTNSSGLGMAVDVNFISIGETHTEYLISWPYALARFHEIGLELLTPDELAGMNLPASTQMFEETWNMANTAGKRYNMTPAVKEFSFTNRWFILKRRAALRPVVMSGPPQMTTTTAVPATATTAVPANASKKSKPRSSKKANFDVIDLV